MLAGDIHKAFPDADVVRALPCQVQTNLPDAIGAAAKGSFTAIAVVMSGTSGGLSSALKALREVNSDAQIILLAQMYEEPEAMRLAGTACNGANLATDYLICPIRTDRFYEFVAPCEKLRARKIETSAGIDLSTETRIRELEKLATEDELTGLKNRRYIWEFSRQIIEHARKRGGRVTFLVFDIDNFKHYNDVYGHSAGDEILKQAAVLMRRCCRGHDVVGRIGGDEFAVVFWDDPKGKPVGSEAERRSASVEHPNEAIFIAKRFIREFEKAELHLLGPRGEGVLTISGGLARFPRDGSTIQELFQQADNALLDAKRSGKNRIYLVGKPQDDLIDIE